MSEIEKLLVESPSGAAHPQPFAAPIAGSPLFCEMAAPPSSSLRPGRAALLGSLRLREEAPSAVPFSGKRPKMTPVGRFTFGDASPMMPLRGSDWSATKLVISPFTDFATKLTPLGALPTPLAQLVHAHGPSVAHARDGDGSSLLKPRRVVHFSQQPARAGPLADAAAEHDFDGADVLDADPLTDLGREPSDLLHNAPHSEPSARTPFADGQMGLPDWARGVGEDVSSLGHVLSIQPTQRGLSPLTSPETDAERARKQALHKRRLQFEGGEAVLEMQHGAATPLRTQRADGSEEPWLLFRDSAILGTPTTGGCETLSLPLGTPNSLKEAFRLSEGLAGKFKTKSMTAGAEPDKDPTAQTLDLQDEAGASCKPKRERGGKENGKGCKPRTCNCKHSKCIKLYCDCFSAGQFCLPSCKCDSCLNNADNEPAREEARKSILERNHHAFTDKVKRLKEEGSNLKGCNCKNSRCMKKYCECYQAGVSCSERCKCVGCANGKPAGDDEGAGAPAAAGDLEDVTAAAELAALSPSAYTSLMVPLKAPYAPLDAAPKPAQAALADEAAAREAAALALLAVSPLRNGVAPPAYAEHAAARPPLGAKCAASPALAPRAGKAESSLIGEMLLNMASPLKADIA